MKAVLQWFQQFGEWLSLKIEVSLLKVERDQLTRQIAFLREMKELLEEEANARTHS